MRPLPFLEEQMSEQEYLELMYVFSNNMGANMIISWSNGLKVKCNAFHGMNESDTEPGDEDYIGEYYTAVKDVEVLHEGSDNSIELYNTGDIEMNTTIEINLFSVPVKIELEDGTVLWPKNCKEGDG
jgi:hypothetical protein